MANRNKGSRGRSRKRRRAPAAVVADGSRSQLAPEAPDGTPRRKPASENPPAKPSGSGARARPRSSARRGRGGAGMSGLVGLGERPPAPWHPLPLSELLILVGAIGTVVGLSRGVSHGGPPLFAGLAAVIIGTVEVTLREHLSGYRSHALILALLPTIALHSFIVLTVAAFTQAPRALTIGLLALDVAVFAALFKLLRARFADARRERVFTGKR